MLLHGKSAGPEANPTSVWGPASVGGADSNYFAGSAAETSGSTDNSVSSAMPRWKRN